VGALAACIGAEALTVEVRGPAESHTLVIRRRVAMPIILWLLGVPITLVLALWLFGVVGF
jgi:hypothetical protein